MAEGFKIASAFVEVKVEDNTQGGLAKVESSVEGWSSKVGEKVGKQVEEDFAKAGERGGRALTGGTVKEFNRDAGGRFKKMGEDVPKFMFGNAGPGFKKFFGDAMNDLPGIAKTAGISAGIIVGVALAPAIISAVGGALLVGASGPFLAMGISEALNDKGVSSSLDELGAKVGDTMSRSSQEFVPQVKASIQILSSAWDTLSPQISAGFKAAAPYVQDLATGVSRLATNIMPGLIKATSAAGPVFAQVKDGLGDVGRAIGGMFEKLSSHGDQAAAGMKFVFGMVSGAIDALGDGIVWVMDTFDDWSHKAESVSRWGEEWLSWLPVVGDDFHKLAVVFDDLNHTMDGDGVKNGARRLKDVGDAGTVANDNVTRLKNQSSLLGDSLTDAAVKAGSLKKALDELNGAAVDSEKAEINYRASIDKATDSLKENGQTVDTHSEQGRKNRQVLLEMQAAIEAKMAATYNETLATKGQAAADQAATAAGVAGRDQLIKTAIQLGMTKLQADMFAQSVLKIPGVKKTEINIEDIEAKSRIDWLKASIAGLTGKTVTIKVKADLPPGISMGMLQHQANGGVVKYYASGGLESHVAQMAPAGSWRVWAEPETGGESYIPHAPAKRKRSVEVLRQTNEILGSPLQERGAGAVAVASGAAQYFQFGPGSVVLDVSRIKSVQDLLALLSTIQTTARQFGGGRPAAWGGAL